MERSSTRAYLHHDTGRLWLRPLEHSDAPLLIEMERDKEVMRFLNGGKTDVEVNPKGDDGYLRPRGPTPGIWAIDIKQSSEFAGWVSLIEEDRGSNVYWLGYRLRRECWGFGYATEAAIAIVDALIRRNSNAIVRAQTMAINAASRRVLARVGLIHIRTEYPSWPDPIAGSEHGEVIYEYRRESGER